MCNRRLLADAIRDGVGLLTWEQETFAYADAWDDNKSRYVVLRAGEQFYISPDPSGLVVKPDVARRQLHEEAQVEVSETAVTGRGEGGELETGKGGDEESERAFRAKPRRFYGSVTLDPVRLSRDAGQVAEAIVQHLTGLVGAKVEGSA